jgi:hypothetical protein
MEDHAPPENEKGRAALRRGTTRPRNRRNRHRNRWRLTDSEVVSNLRRRHLSWLSFCDRVLASLEFVPRRAFWEIRHRRDAIQTELQRISSDSLALSKNDQPPVQWLKILVQVPVPIQAIYSSGGENVLALIGVQARSKDEWDQTRRDCCCLIWSLLTSILWHLRRCACRGFQVVRAKPLGASKSSTTPTLNWRQSHCFEKAKGYWRP